MRQFSGSAKSFPAPDPGVIARLASAAADVALLIDKRGTILDLAGDEETFPLNQWAHWVGQNWVDVVTVESRTKVQAMQRDALAGLTSRWRHLNHVGSDDGEAVPVMYRVVPLGTDGAMVALGRDLQEMAELQRRMLDAQQALDREEKQRRQAEARQRLLFQSTADPLFVVDSISGRVFESNPAGDRWSPAASRRRGDGIWGENFDSAGADAIRSLMTRVRNTGRFEQIEVRSVDAADFIISATPFREDGVSLAMVRIAPALTAVKNLSMWQSPESRPSLSAVADYAPEAIVRTDLNGMIVAANAAFLGMVQASSDASVRGEFLDRWLGGAGVDLRVLMANARQHGVMRRFSTTLRDAQDHQVDVELAAVSLPEETVPGFGFLIREVPRSHALGTDAGEIGRVGGRSVDQLTELVGRVPLKELVREAADVIERLAIEAALKLTADNRALASDLLGLSRQSLYIKLHRYGLGDLEADAALPSPTTVESSKAARPGQGGALAKKKGAAPTGASSRRRKADSPPAPPPRGKQRG